MIEVSEKLFSAGKNLGLDFQRFSLFIDLIRTERKRTLETLKRAKSGRRGVKSDRLLRCFSGNNGSPLGAVRLIWIYTRELGGHTKSGMEESIYEMA